MACMTHETCLKTGVLQCHLMPSCPQYYTASDAGLLRWEVYAWHAESELLAEVAPKGNLVPADTAGARLSTAQDAKNQASCT